MAIPNILTPTHPFSVKVETADGPRTLHFKLTYDFNALALIEQETGYSQLNGAIFKHLTVTNGSVLFWAAIYANHKEYRGKEGLEAVRGMMTLASWPEFSKAINEAYIISLPDEQQKKIRELEKQREEGGEPPLAAAPTPSAAE